MNPHKYLQPTTRFLQRIPLTIIGYWLLFHDSFQPHDYHLSQIPLPVAINPYKIQYEIWLSPKTAIPLHRRKETIDKVNKKYNH